MPIQVIRHRYTQATLFELDAPDVKAAVVAAVRGGADLGGADLGGAYLRGAYLGGAYLRGADLGGADLGGADLGGADLGGADLGGAYLRGADLGGAYLRGADLGGADLGGADLGGALISWQSHALLGELLRRAAWQDTDPAARLGKLKVAGLVTIATEWCWRDFERAGRTDPLWPWAIDTLAAYVRDDDSAPPILRTRAKELGIDTTPPKPAVEPAEVQTTPVESQG